jgi:hypothetical protein
MPQTMDPDSDPGPAIFVINLQDANKTIIKKKGFSAFYLLFEGTFTTCFKCT